MNISYKIAAAALALAAGTVAQATTLTFDNLVTQYGDGAPVGAHMTSDGQSLAYGEAGYVLTLHTDNGSAHIGDATNVSGTFNWHDQGDNLVGAYVTLTRANGGLFSLLSFDYNNYYDNSLTVDGGAGPVSLSGGGTYSTAFDGVSSVSFASNNYNYNQLDNILLSVPEPATWGLMLVGFGAVGVAARRRKGSVSFS